MSAIGRLRASWLPSLKRRRASGALLLALLVPAMGIVGCNLRPGFFDQVVFVGLDRPTSVEFSADGRVFVTEKRGLVKVFEGVDDTSASIVADLRPQVYNNIDRGLLGLALHPGFPQVPYIYVAYTLDAGPDGVVPRWGGTSDIDPCPTPPGPTDDGCVVTARVSRLEVSPDSQQVGPEAVLVEDWCQQYPSHSIGTVAFGADGALYAGGGDGASYNWADYGQAGDPPNPCGDPGADPDGVPRPPAAEGGTLRSQDLRTPGDPTGLAGTIIRIDPLTGAALPSNPLAAAEDPNAQRIVAYGLRNPFRFAMRPGTSEIWIGDVGWYLWEEINITQGDDDEVDNFGWPCFEGDEPHPVYGDLGLDLCDGLAANDTTGPHYRYAHGQQFTGAHCATDRGSSVSGMTFLPTTTTYPDQFRGALFFADAARGCIFVMSPDAAGVPDPATIGKFATVGTPVELEVGPGGEIWYVDLYGGAVRRIGYSRDSGPPQAAVVATATSGDPPLTVTFDATGSTDPDGDELRYAWDLDGDGDLDDGNDPIVTTTYDTVGTRTVTLRVTDPAGTTDTTQIVVRVGTVEAKAEIWSPPSDVRFAVGDMVTLEGGVTLGDGTLLDAEQVGWAVDILHCEADGSCHRHPDLAGASASTSMSFVMPDHEYPAHVELHLGAHLDGQVVMTTRRIDYRTTELTVATDPAVAGVPVVLGTVTVPAPSTRALPVGSTVTISAPAVVEGPSGPLVFSSWSDGGPRIHEIVVPDAAATLVALYEPG